MKTWRVTFHLQSGNTIKTLIEYDDSMDETEIYEDVHKALTGNGRPHWIKYENVIAFSQAVSAVEIEEVTNPEVTHR